MPVAWQRYSGASASRWSSPCRAWQGSWALSWTATGMARRWTTWPASEETCWEGSSRRIHRRVGAGKPREAVMGLKESYSDVVNVAGEVGIADMNVKEEGGKLIITG